MKNTVFGKSSMLPTAISYLIVAAILLAAVCVAVFSPSYEQTSGEPISIIYSASGGGKIMQGDNLGFHSLQSVKYGGDTKKVTAVADDGFYFVGWSDGVKTLSRVDKNIQKEREFTAKFAEITLPVHLTYTVHGGTVVGKALQTVQRGHSGSTVCVKSTDPNAVFMGWSDGVMTEERTDNYVTKEVCVQATYGYRAVYFATGGGSIIGQPSQTVPTGETTETVTAMPDKGNVFVKWSDGLKNPTRSDIANAELRIAAIFSYRDPDRFTYHYNLATANNTQKEIEIKRGEIRKAKCVIPEREHFTFGGWYLDRNFTQRVFDELGTPCIGDELFDAPTRELYAEWTVKQDEKKTFNVLMVYVTKIDAMLKNIKTGEKERIQYEFSRDEIDACLDLSERVSETFYELTDELVTLNVDSYFTVKAVTEEDFCSANGRNNLYACNIDELKNSSLLDKYDLIVARFTFGSSEDRTKYSIGDDKLSKYIGSYYNYETDSGNEQLTVSEEFAVDCIDSMLLGGRYSGRHSAVRSLLNGLLNEELYSVMPCDNEKSIDYLCVKLYLCNQYPVDLSIDDGNLVELWLNSTKIGFFA